MPLSRRTLSLAILGAGLALLSACSGPTYVAQQYDGPPRPRESIAVVRVNAQDPVLLDSLDGEVIAVRLPEGSRLHVEVLPGPHRVGVANALDLSAPPVLVDFVAQPGKVYRPVWVAAPSSARIYEVDRDSDALLYDVTTPPPAPKRPAPAPAPPEPPPAEEPAPSPSSEAPSSEPAPEEGGTAPSTENEAPAPSLTEPADAPSSP